MADIYDIVEKVTEVKQSVDKMATDVTEIKTQQAVLTHIVNEHHRRSTNLEEAMKPIQAHVTIVQKIMYFLGAILIAVAVQWAIKLLT